MRIAKGSVLDIEIHQDWGEPKEQKPAVAPLMLPAEIAISLDPGNRTMMVLRRGDNVHRPITCQAVYSKLKEMWMDSTLISYPFPMVAITPVLFQMQYGWKLRNPECLVFEAIDYEVIDEDIGLECNE